MRLRRKPKLTPAVELQDGGELRRALARYLYAQLDGAPADAHWVMSGAWFDVVNDLLGDPLPAAGQFRAILGRRVVFDSGRPRLVA